MTTVINSINNNLTNGLFYKVYSGYMNNNPNYFSTATFMPIGTSGTSGTNNQGLVTNISNIDTGTNGFIKTVSAIDNFSIQWFGYFRSNYTGNWTFYTASDDCSYLWIGSTAISDFSTTNALVNNGGTHPVQERTGTISLQSNTYYPIRIQFGEFGGGQDIQVYFSNAGGLAKTSNGTGFYYYQSNGVLTN
jgi:hypothetical protein